MENSNEKALKALDTAIKQESDGVKFYTEAINKCKHPLGKSMFQSFVEDEKEHLKRLKKLRSAESGSLHSMGDTQSAKDRLLSVFSDMKGELESIVKPESDDLVALQVAMDLELKGHKLYKTGYEKATCEREKELYKFLAKEEIIHHEILKNTYNYLDNLDKTTAKDEDRGYDLWARMINEV